MRLSEFVKKYQAEFPYYFGIIAVALLVWFFCWMITHRPPHIVQQEQAKPLVQAYVDKYGATNRFLCDNGIYVEEYIDSYGEITRRVMTNKDLTVKSALRCSDNVNINTTEIVGGGLIYNSRN